ncbi:hypothetical protein FLM48_14160 [Shewanella sp. Scap07]|uniref:hypothetical protein n=1 Tax=Shewanella sp. Scap07 TaxID=2589987 RepID=UPI0015BBA386|nr:hypothetical protein [Shewanella sp. Scap07]QLE86110.1 hypothetical protein FLM48_14160 [Shewanella sp. Scap07]
MNRLKALSKKSLGLLGIGYLDTKLYRLVDIADGQFKWQEAPVNFKPNVLILSRQHYQESCKQYPIENKSEVKKLIRLELSANEGTSQFVTYKAQDSKTASNQWMLSDVYLGAKFVLPESFLIGAKQPHFKVTELQNEESQFYIVNTPKGIISTVKGGLINNVNAFSMASGVSVDQTINSMSFEQFANFTAAELPQLLIQYGSQFFVKQDSNLDVQDLVKPVFLTLGASLTLYLLIGSAYLELQSYRITSQIESNSSQVNRALNIQNEYNQLTEKLLRQQDFIESQAVKTSFWLVLEPLLQQAKFRTIRYRNDRYIINGETKQATKLLDMLIQDPLVTDAKFDSQIRKSRNNEVFTISFRLSGAS